MRSPCDGWNFLRLKIDDWNMIQQQYPSQLLEKAVSEFSKLPGIGRKTALRLVLWMLRQEDGDVEQFTEAV